MEQLELDGSQVQALELALTSQATVIAGAAGTGKTTVLTHAATRLMEAGQSLVILAAGRRAADDLRTRLTLQHGRLPQNVTVRTAQAWAFTILQAYAADRDRQTPELITGPTQDAIIAELLSELGDDVPWPAEVTEEVMELPGFRAELRDLLTRAAELGLRGTDLAALGRDQGEQMWIAAGELIDHYESALALEDATAPGGGGADRFDHARLVHQAARLLDTPDSWTEGDAPRWDWVLVDDYQNATLASAALLSAVHSGGARLVLTADPDTAVEGFRGGIAHLPGLARGSKDGLGFNADVLVLSTRHRAGEKLAQIQDALVSRIGVAGISSHRAPAAGNTDDSLAIMTFPGADQQLSGIARIIRHRHVREGVPYDDMAVITRARNAHTELERVLGEAGVDVRPADRDQPLRYIPVVRALMDVILEAGGSRLDELQLLNLLASPLVGLEPLEMRALRRRVTHWSVERDIAEPVRALLTDDSGESWARPLRRLATIIDSARGAIESGGNAEAVLWAAWKSAGNAEDWREAALRGGSAGRAANAMLDAAMRMFRVAQRMVDRDGRASASQLVDELDSQEIAEDSIARMGRESGVHLLTPAMAIGQDFDLVIVADLNDDVWPNLRARDGLFGAGRLAEMHLDRLTDGVSGVRSVLDDELRMLAAAAGRAKSSLVLTAVDSEEVSRSRFIDLIARDDEIEKVEASQLSMSISGVVGRLRSVLSDPELGVGEDDRETAADILASLPTWTDQKITGIDPATWVPIIEPSTDATWGTDMWLSPSAVEAVSSCPLNWFLDSRGFTDKDDTRRLEIGSLIHEVAEEHPNGSLDELMESFEEKWVELARQMDDGFERITEYRNARSMIEALAAYMGTSPDAEVEQKVHVETEHFTVNGRIDRIEHSEDGPFIVDFKTGKSMPSEKAALENPQLKIYQWAYEQVTGTPTAGARLVFPAQRYASGLPKERVQHPLTDEDRKTVDEMLMNVKDDLSRADLAARINDRCRTCRAKTVCPLYEEGALFS